jgi:hypothetical protein
MQGMFITVCMAIAYNVTAVELVAGGSGWALQFDGRDDFVNLPVTLPPAPWTIEMWVHPFSLKDGEQKDVVKFNNAGALLAQASIIKGLTWTQGHILVFSFLGSLESIPRLSFR